MPETYITISDEKGSINISEDVIAVISANAVTEVDGIAAFSNICGADLGELIGKKSATKGVRVSFEDGNILIDITAMVRYGTNITAVGEKVQKAVANSVESMIGQKPAVNVHIAGVTFEK